MPMYIICPDCGFELLTDRFQPANKESMHDPKFLVSMGSKLKDEGPLQCPKCRYQIDLLQQTFYWKD